MIYGKVLPFLNKRPLMASVGPRTRAAALGGASDAVTPIAAKAREETPGRSTPALEEAARFCVASSHGVSPRRADALVEMGVRHVFLEQALQDLGQVPGEQLAAAPAAAFECARAAPSPPPRDRTRDALADATPEAARGRARRRCALRRSTRRPRVWCPRGRPPPRDASAATAIRLRFWRREQHGGGGDGGGERHRAAARASPMGASFTAPTLPPGVPAVEAETLARVIRCVEGVFQRVAALRRRALLPPPLLHAAEGEGGDGDAEALPDMRCPSAACSAPLFGRLAGVNDGGDAAIEALAGAQPPPIVRPVELTLVPDRVANIGEAAAAVRKAVHCCVLLANQSELLPNTFALRASLLVHLFCSVLPAPMPLNHPRRLSSCFWASDRDVRYETQAEILRCLRLLLQHFGAATLSLTATRSFDAARLLSLASLASIADAVLRLRVDHPSPFCQHYAGDADGPTAPFGFEMGPSPWRRSTFVSTVPSAPRD